MTDNQTTNPDFTCSDCGKIDMMLPLTSHLICADCIKKKRIKFYRR